MTAIMSETGILKTLLRNGCSNYRPDQEAEPVYLDSL
jgi:hypothetical protein